MATKTQEQLLNDIKTQITQFVYRSSLQPTDALFAFLQETSKVGNMNWHLVENKEKLASVFTQLIEVIKAYTLAEGDFRTYIVLHLTTIIVNTYEDELFDKYLNQGYNVDPSSVVGALSDAYSTAPPQNTNFPGKDNTSNDYVPIPATLRLVPSSLYGDD